MQYLTWKQLEEFLGNLTEEQKAQPVTILDNNHESIYKIDDIGITDMSYYATFEGVYSTEDIEDYDEEDLEQFKDDVHESIEEGAVILMID